MADRWFCPVCEGTGFIEYDGIPGHACERCNGSGRVDELPFMPATVFYHEHPKVGVCEHQWSEPAADWDRSKDYMPTCDKCGMSLMAHAFMEMP